MKSSRTNFSNSGGNCSSGCPRIATSLLSHGEQPPPHSLQWRGPFSHRNLFPCSSTSPFHFQNSQLFPHLHAIVLDSSLLCFLKTSNSKKTFPLTSGLPAPVHGYSPITVCSAALPKNPQNGHQEKKIQPLPLHLSVSISEPSRPPEDLAFVSLARPSLAFTLIFCCI